jgi:hypothetical protein
LGAITGEQEGHGEPGVPASKLIIRSNKGRLMNHKLKTPLALAIASLLAGNAYALPSTNGFSSQSSYFTPTTPGVTSTAILTTGDSVGGYTMGGLPDGLGAFDNGDNTFTVLMNHEWGATAGAGNLHSHGAIGAYQSKWVIDKSSLQVVSGGNLITSQIGWNSGTQSVGSSVIKSLDRLCSADLPNQTALYNPLSGLGTQEKIFMAGEESGVTGWVTATVATGADAGKLYQLGKFNLNTNGSGGSAWGGWENVLLNPGTGDKTVAIGNNDGGTGIMNNSLAVYVGTKTNVGTEVDKAGLTNGTLKFVNIAGSTAEIVNTTTRATNIASGTAFTLSDTASTVFSRPEDGAWNPLDPSQYYFVTTDRLDQVADGIGTQVGKSRLWRLNFADVTNPNGGGTIDLLIDGVGVNMLDNIGVDLLTGHVLLQEDVGNAAHNGKIFDFDPTTLSLIQLGMHDQSRFGNIGVPATSPYGQDEEFSGIIDVTSILGRSDGRRYYLSADQDHSTINTANHPISNATIEGGQLVLISTVPVPGAVWMFGSALAGMAALRRKKA